MSHVLQEINFFRLCKICQIEEDAIVFCQTVGLLPKQSSCPSCNKRINKIYKVQRSGARKAHFRFQCNHRSCKKSGKNQVSIRKDTLFENLHISIRKTLLLIYTFVLKLQYEDICTELAISSDEETKAYSKPSTKTVADLHKTLREVCQYAVENHICDKKIGGVGKTVQIDEAKFGKRKYNKGRMVSGTWVLGGICSESGDMFLEVVDKRNKETLIPLILKHVEPGSTIVTDCWKAYGYLSLYDFEHLTVNHTYNFVGKYTFIQKLRSFLKT